MGPVISSERALPPSRMPPISALQGRLSSRQSRPSRRSAQGRSSRFLRCEAPPLEGPHIHEDPFDGVFPDRAIDEGPVVGRPKSVTNGDCTKHPIHSPAGDRFRDAGPLIRIPFVFTRPYRRPGGTA
jgi:hypothetical protein